MRDESGGERQRGHPGPAAVGNPTRVVVVEDQPDIASALRELVESDGTAVVVAVCHTLAIGSEMVQRFLPDVVLTDFRLPDGDAVDQFAAWRMVAPDTRILVASAWTDDRSLRRAMAAGASGYVEKGQQLMGLSSVIARVVAGEDVWSASPPTHASPAQPSPDAVPAGADGPATKAVVDHSANGWAERGDDDGSAATLGRLVLAGVLAERSTDQISSELGLTPFEVRQQVNFLLRSAGVRSRAALRDHHRANA